MALSKIELKVGKGKNRKVITLTTEQFEELKQDMRDLDKSHHYYWYNYQWPRWYSQPHWSGSPILCNNIAGSTTTTGVITNASTGTASLTNTSLINTLEQLAPEDRKDPPAYTGSILSVS